MRPTLPTTLPEFPIAAGAALKTGAYDYISGGATDEWTLAENVAAWRRLTIVPRVLTGSSGPDTRVTVLGKVQPHPLIAAPMAYQRIATGEGEIAMARAAAATATIMCLSTLSNVSASDVVAAVPNAQKWYQVYVFSDRAITDRLIDEALSAGYEALVVTVDFPVSGIRERDLRSGFNVSSAVPSLADTGVESGFEPHQAQHATDAALSWKDVEAMAGRYQVPVLVKGILTPDDALLAFAHGAAGIVVSNHGGRQLDGAPATATVLAEIVDAVAGRGDVLVDGGIRRGTDVLRALALGANAVMIGRPLYWGLAVGGAAGAQRVLELFLDELRNALILCGAHAAQSLDRRFLGALIRPGSPG
ncbi:MAG: alpha-hydroxy acid oxidase [Candidatus Dormibacteria bacterium]